MVRAILASALLRAAKEQASPREPSRLSTGFEPIDEALGGGILTGQITSISGEHGTGKTLVRFCHSTALYPKIIRDFHSISISTFGSCFFLTCSQIALHVLISHLISKPTAQAAIIDTTGTLDILRLHQIILYRLRSKQAAERAAATSHINPKLFYPDCESDDTEKRAGQVLDRVKIMRVFDFVGVSEAVSELRDDIRNASKDRALAAAWAAEPTPKMTHVDDSQAEEGEEDLMLFDDVADVEPADVQGTLEPVSLVVIDNITNVVNTILKSNYVQGQAILSSFMHSLSAFCKDASIIAILLNNAASPRQAYTSFPGLAQLNRGSNLPAGTFIPDPQANTSVGLADQPSVFASTTAQPSLGKTFGALVDCHLLISMLPKRKKDAEILVGGKAGKAEVVNVVEVLSVKGSAGVGRWAAFEIAEQGTRLNAPR
jgi:RecA/RadA recombinase